VKLNKTANIIENATTGVKVSYKGCCYTSDVAVNLLNETPKDGC